VCPFHQNCAEGLTAGPAIARRLGINRTLSSEPTIFDLVAGYLGELAASLVLCWSPERIIWGGGVMATPGLLERLQGFLEQTLAGYGVGAAVLTRDFCALPALVDSGLEGALLMARALSREAPE
jgi:fructokinase